MAGPVACRATGSRVGDVAVRVGGPLLVGLSIVIGACTPHAEPALASPVVGAQVAYPQAEQKAGIAGSASIDCTITRQGVVRDCVVLRASNPDFAQTALDFVQHAHYSPAMHNGVPIDQHHHTWTINYRP